MIRDAAQRSANEGSIAINMTIHHRLNLWATISGPILEALGLSFPANPPADGRIVIPDVPESDPSWPRVAVLLNEYHRAWADHPSNADPFGRPRTQDSLADFAHAKFSAAEPRSAAFLALDASLLGFPEFQSILEFYQKSRGIFMLNWVADEFLVKPEMYEKVFRPFGIGSRSVLDFRCQAVLQTVVQLEIPLRADVDPEDARYQICGSCGGPSYDRDATNYAPMPFSAPGPLFKSNQWFNPFHSIVYMTQDLCRAIGESGFRGAYSIPCASAGRSR